MADSLLVKVSHVPEIKEIKRERRSVKPGAGGARVGAGRPKKGVEVPREVNSAQLEKQFGPKKVGRPKDRKLRNEIREEILLRNQIARQIRDQIPFGIKHRSQIDYPEITEQEIEKEFKKRVAYSAHKLLNAQMSLALGTQTLYKVHTTVDNNGKIQRMHSQVTDPDEVQAYLDDPNLLNGEDYYYITTKAPDNNAINAILDRLMGKASNKIVGANNPDGSEGPIKVIVANFSPDKTLESPATQPIIETAVAQVISDEENTSDSQENTENAEKIQENTQYGS